MSTPVIEIKERVDVRNVAYIYENRERFTNNNPTMLAQVTKLYKNAVMGNGIINVPYHYANGKNSGRLQGPGGLQGLRRDIRNTVAGHLYTDIDIVNCHPVVLLQYLSRHNILVPNSLRDYVTNREQILQSITDTNNIARSIAKKIIVSLINGSGGKEFYQLSSPSQWLTTFKSDMSGIRNEIKRTHPDAVALVKSLKKINKNISGSVISHILQDIEGNILKAIVDFLKDIGLNTYIGTQCFDGMMILNESGVNNDLLTKIEESVLNTTGYSIDLVIKPMDNPIIKVPDDFQPDLINYSSIMLKESHEINMQKIVNTFAQYCKDFIFSPDGSIYRWNGTFWQDSSKVDVDKLFQKVLWNKTELAMESYITKIRDNLDTVKDCFSKLQLDKPSNNPCGFPLKKGGLCIAKCSDGYRCKRHMGLVLVPLCRAIVDSNGDLCGKPCQEGSLCCSKHKKQSLTVTGAYRTSVGTEDLSDKELYHTALIELKDKISLIKNSSSPNGSISSNELLAQLAHLTKLDLNIANCKKEIGKYLVKMETFINRVRSYYNQFRTNKHATIISNVISLSTTPLPPEWVNHPNWFVFKDRVYDLAEQKFIEVKKEDMLFSKSNIPYCDYNEVTTNKLIGVIRKGLVNQDKYECFMTFMATSLIAKTNDVIAICTGVGNGDCQGSNMKTFITDVLKSFLKGTFYEADPRVLNDDGNGGPDPTIANMNFKLVTRFDEVMMSGKKNGAISETRLKLLTGQATTGRACFSNKTDVDLKHTVFINTNYELYFRNQESKAIRRRIVVFRFDSVFHSTESDRNDAIASGGDPAKHHLKDNSLIDWINQPEVCGQLFYILAPYAQNYIDAQYNFRSMIPETIGEDTNSYLNKSDDLKQWLEDHLVMSDNPDDRISAAQLLKLYRDEFPSMSKKEKQKFNLKWLKSKLVKYPETKAIYRDKKNFKKTCIRSCLWGVTFTNLPIDLDNPNHIPLFGINLF